jgi:ABC-type nickel/cobalt efflux system permease component RcnA
MRETTSERLNREMVERVRVDRKADLNRQRTGMETRWRQIVEEKEARHLGSGQAVRDPVSPPRDTWPGAEPRQDGHWPGQRRIHPNRDPDSAASFVIALLIGLVLCAGPVLLAYLQNTTSATHLIAASIIGVLVGLAVFVAYLIMRAVVGFVKKNRIRCIAFAGVGVALAYHYFG